jgi:hypothetical protein
MNNKIDNKGFLKEKLGEYRVDPPESVWENISARLGGGNRRTIILITLASAATIALAITLGISYFGSNQSLDRSISGMQPGPQDEPGLTETAPEQDLAPHREAVENREITAANEERGEGAEAPGHREGEENIEVPDDREREDFGVPGDRRLKEKVLAVLEAEQEESSESDEGILQDRKDAVPVDPAKTAEAWNPPHDPAGQQLEQENTPDRVADMEEVPLVEPLEWEEEKRRGQARWALGAVLSPLYSFRDAEMDALEAGGDFESGMLSYAGGIQVSYRAAGRLAIESGLLFNKMGISIGAPGIMEFNSSLDYAMTEGAAERSNWVAVSNSVGNIVSKSGDIYVNNYKMNALVESGNFQDNLPVEATTADEGIQQHLEYLELPVNVRYTLVDRTFELQLIGGLSTNFLVSNYVTMKTPNGKEEIGYLSNIRNVNYSGNAGVGMIYHIHRKFSLSLEPRFRYFLHSVNDETLPSTRPYSLGFYTGIRYTF